ncbi:hypothetical protein PCANC_15102 [Puccinia coronata f. sp. avenae]|uniref:Uncharacterized protein n=1 Tax=Puccinia coronata f. sp. avenae TaxID=200324 RepID=A0A2N5SQX6_9BASI|nr:hypothetical protein PCANC_15102 [Puccinia coronata f. sp. avenae]
MKLHNAFLCGILSQSGKGAPFAPATFSHDIANNRFGKGILFFRDQGQAALVGNLSDPTLRHHELDIANLS